MRRWVTRGERAEIVRLYKSGMASLAVAERMNLSKSSVLRILKAECVVLRPQGTKRASVSWASWTGDDGWVSRFVEDIRRASAQGQLGERFRAADVRQACVRAGQIAHTVSSCPSAAREIQVAIPPTSSSTATGTTACSTDGSQDGRQGVATIEVI